MQALTPSVFPCYAAADREVAAGVAAFLERGADVRVFLDEGEMRPGEDLAGKDAWWVITRHPSLYLEGRWWALRAWIADGAGPVDRYAHSPPRVAMPLRPPRPD